MLVKYEPGRPIQEREDEELKLFLSEKGPRGKQLRAVGLETGALHRQKYFNPGFQISDLGGTANQNAEEDIRISVRIGRGQSHTLGSRTSTKWKMCETRV